MGIPEDDSHGFIWNSHWDREDYPQPAVARYQQLEAGMAAAQEAYNSARQLYVYHLGMRNCTTNHITAAATLAARESELRAVWERTKQAYIDVRTGRFEPILVDMRPRRPALNPNYTRGSGTPKYLGEEFINPRTGEAISDDDAWLLAENRRRKYPELLASLNPKEPLSKVSRGKYANAITKRAKAAQQTFDRFTPFGLEYRAGNHYGQADYSKYGVPIPKGERWLDHEEEIEHLLKVLPKSDNPVAIEKHGAKTETEPVRFWWDKDADLTPVESMERLAAVQPTRRLQVMLPLQNSNIEAVQYELPSKHNENIGVRRIKAIPFEKATPFKAASVFKVAKPASKHWR